MCRIFAWAVGIDAFTMLGWGHFAVAPGVICMTDQLPCHAIGACQASSRREACINHIYRQFDTSRGIPKLHPCHDAEALPWLPREQGT